MLSLTKSVRISRVFTGKAAGTRTPAALLTALALAAVAGCSSASASPSPSPSASASASPRAGSSSGGEASADQKAAAAVTVRAMHDLGSNDYTDLCAIVAPGSSMLASGLDGCVNEKRASIRMAAAQQPGVEAFLGRASEFTVNASKVVVDGDSATVPTAAILYKGRPAPDLEGISEQKLIRKNGRWYLIS